jgi:osmotically inducible protein OsmC
MKRNKATAVWQKGLKDGSGKISMASGTITDVPYSFGMRFEDAKGTNPEELIAAAHASCFSMALSAQLGNEGLTAENISTTATVSLENKDGGFAVTSSHLEVTAKIPGADVAKFNKAAENAKTGCPISKLLNTKITMEARLEN